MRCRWCKQTITDVGGAWHDDGPMLRHVCTRAPRFITSHEPRHQLSPLAQLLAAVAICVVVLAVIHWCLSGGVIK